MNFSDIYYDYNIMGGVPSDSMNVLKSQKELIIQQLEQINHLIKNSNKLDTNSNRKILKYLNRIEDKLNTIPNIMYMDPFRVSF